MKRSTYLWKADLRTGNRSPPLCLVNLASNLLRTGCGLMFPDRDSVTVIDSLC